MSLNINTTRHVIFKTRKTVFDLIFKHREGSWKHDTHQTIFDELRGVCKCRQTRSFVCLYNFLIETKTKDKNKRKELKS